ncbi:NAD-dependent epimerase/dehydratase family protein [Nesterenkonia halotolerans]|uniref:Nucleoside-diphosphate-sugar epimerase n=1 Tax=Nesterenkonia halotolerans TaxID=225325 RepID=A0ABR9J392_9MICC|nr:NAD-dependent epimerase/dehydratase family protein [Nesterenkonia halotolerans]MBE1513473.1 nucleoside-diphosphate-sugar epimerase [Nesterenkonia halotolerans]
MTRFIEPGARVLVTGASGLLGRSVAQRLVAEGYFVTVLQRRASALDGVREIRGSLADPAAVARATQDQDAVIHMAAKVSVSGAHEDFLEVNVRGTQRLLDAAQSSGVTDFLHVSSPSVAHAGVSLVGAGASQADPRGAVGSYAQTKARAELIAEARGASGLNVLVLRPHLVWGPGDGQLTSRIIERARSGRMPILGSGAALVDTLYIDNAVDAFLAGLRRLPQIAGQRLVLTNGEPRPIGELITGIAAAGGAPAPRLRLTPGLAKGAGAVVERLWGLSERIAGPRADEPPMTKFLAEQLSTAHWFDQRTTQQALDWTPRVSIDEGLERLREHIQFTGSVL